MTSRPSRTTTLLLAATLSLATTLAAPALADSPRKTSPQDMALAEAAFNEGVKLIEEGNCKDAIAKFELSNKIDPAAGTSLNLGKCYEDVGRTASAYGAYSESVGLARIKVNDKIRTDAEARLAALAPTLSKIELHFASEAPKDVSLTIDGKPISAVALETAVPVDPGSREIQISAPGKLPWKTTLQIDAKPGTTPVQVPALQDAPAPPGADTSMPTGIKVAVIGLAALGAAGLGVGIGFGADSLGKNDASRKECRPDNPNLCSAAGVDLRNQAYSSATIANIGIFAGGGALLAAGGLFLVYRFALQSPPSSGEPAVTGIRVGPGGVTVLGQW